MPAKEASSSGLRPAASSALVATSVPATFTHATSADAATPDATPAAWKTATEKKTTALMPATGGGGGVR